jgi:hypothetical protein
MCTLSLNLTFEAPICKLNFTEDVAVIFLLMNGQDIKEAIVYSGYSLWVQIRICAL